MVKESAFKVKFFWQTWKRFYLVASLYIIGQPGSFGNKGSDILCNSTQKMLTYKHKIVMKEKVGCSYAFDEKGTESPTNYFCINPRIYIFLSVEIKSSGTV